MANGFQEAVRLAPEDRGEWLLLALALGAAGALAITLADIAPASRAWLGLGVALRVGLELRRRRVPRGSASVLRATGLAGGRWRLETGSGTVDATLRHAWGDSLGPVIALEWACEDGRTRQAWIWRHRCPPAQWRRLRVRLRLA